MNVRSATTGLVLGSCFAAPLCWIFFEAISTSRTFVFRDAAHYYHPLFQWTASEWGKGRVPQWSPLENHGTPVIADPTASVFYPGKLLFALPGKFVTRYKLYILSHVLLAGAAAYFTARQWSASRPAATACAMSYAFGGSVVFQYCNVVYLVGAAWLPLAFWSADRLLRRQEWIWALALGAVLAMMVLGGDPQTAYHAGLVAVLGLVVSPRSRRGGWLTMFRRWSEMLRGPRSASRARHQRFLTVLRRSSKQFGRRAPAPPPPRRRFSLRHPALLLCGAALVAGLLAAVQILPATEWTRRSERAVFDEPRTLYEIPEWLSRDAPPREEKTFVSCAKLFLVRPSPDTHHSQLYEFSVAPWRWAEFVWPNFSGRVFPVWRRWIQAVPAEGRFWSPTLYLGLAPLIAAAAAWRLRGRSARTRWLSWTAVLSLLAALGWYGLGWLWLETRQALGHDGSNSRVGAPTGGLYWFLTQVLPGYVYFRYPAKWLTVTSLAISLLAARGWDAAYTGHSPRAMRLLVASGVTSLVGLLVLWGVRPHWNAWLAAAPPDDFFGPIDANGAARDLHQSLMHGALLSGVLLVMVMLMVMMTRRRMRAGLRFASIFAVVVTAMDLSLAHEWIAPTAPAEIWDGVPKAAAVIRDDAAGVEHSQLRIFRASPSRWLPHEWMQTSSAERQIDGLVWDHASLYPKHHLLADVSLVESRGSIVAADFAALMKVAREHGFRRPDGVWEPAPEVLQMLGVDYAVLPREAMLPGGRRIAQSLESGDLSQIAVWRTSPPVPRARLVDQVVVMPELDEPTPSALQRRTREVLFENGLWRDFRRVAVIETSRASEAAAFLEESGASGALEPAHSRIVAEWPQGVQIEVDVTRPSLLVLADLYDPGWSATYTSDAAKVPRPLEIFRTNRVQRGVWLPAGRGRVAIAYSPRSFYLGAGISLIAWLAMVVWVGWSVARSRRARQQ